MPAFVGGSSQRLNRILAILDCEGHPSIEEYVRAFLSGIRLADRYPPSNAKANLAHAENLIKWIDQGLRLLDNPAPEFNALALFAPSESLVRSLAAEKRWAQINATLNLADRRWNKLRSELLALRDCCKWIAENKIGRHGLAGFRQARAAQAALAVTRKCGVPAIYSDPDSPYCRIASIFYEELTGEKDQEIRRACERVARAANTEKRPSS